jgi:hypothetical protein
MPDASTWVLVSLAPATAGACALWINGSRLRHERQLARFDALRKLFAEAGELLTAALSDPETVEPPQTLARQYPELRQAFAGVRLQMFRSRLLLWFAPIHPVITTWGSATEHGTLYMARNSQRALRSNLPADVQADEARQLSESQEAFEKAFDDWMVVAREHLEQIAPKVTARQRAGTGQNA